MSNITNLMTIFLGDYPIVELGPLGTVAIQLAKNVHITIHILGLPVTVKVGDKLPLFTRVPYNPEPIDALLGKPSE